MNDLNINIPLNTAKVKSTEMSVCIYLVVFYEEVAIIYSKTIAFVSK